MDIGILDTPTKHLSAFSVAALAEVDRQEVDVAYHGYAANPDDAITLMREAFAEDYGLVSNKIICLMNVTKGY